MAEETRKRKRKVGVNETDLRSRENEAVQLHVAGLTLAAIAERLGWADPSGAGKAIKRALDRATFRGATTMRRLEAAKLDEVHRRMMLILIGKDVPNSERVAAAKQITHVVALRARLFGLNAPEVVRFEAELDKVFETLRSLVSEDEFEKIAEAIAERDRREAPGAEPSGSETSGSALPN